MEQFGSGVLSARSLAQAPVGLHDDSAMPLQNVSQLPTEIMCQIFLFVRWAYETDPDLIPFSKEYLQWIQACSHVSQHWRRISVNHQILWTNPPLHLPRLKNAMLQRSKAAPLSLVLDLNWRHLASAISAVTANTSLVRSLEVWCSHTLRNFANFLSVLPENFAILEELSINHGRRPYPDIKFYLNDDDDDGVHILEGQLCSCPALRIISLKHVNIACNSRIFGETVTQLSIVNVPRGARFNAQELRTMFGCMPNIIDLCLSHACRNEERSLRNPPGIQLSKLEKIGIGSSANEMGLIFDNIVTAPTLCSVTLHFQYSEPHPNNPASIDLQLHWLLSTLSHPCWSGRTGQGTRIIAMSQNHGIVGDGVYDFTASLSSHPMENPIKFSLGICINPGLRDYGQVLAQNRYITEVLFRQLHCSNLHALTLNDSLDIPSDTLATTFGTLRHLAVIYAYGPCTHSLTHALQRGYNEDDISLIPDPVPFPALQYLRLTNHVFDDWMDRNPMSFDELRMCLTRRLEWDVAIQSLDLDTCYHKVPGELFELRELLSDEVDCLGDLVDNVTWNKL